MGSKLVTLKAKKAGSSKLSGKSPKDVEEMNKNSIAHSINSLNEGILQNTSRLLVPSSEIFNEEVAFITSPEEVEQTVIQENSRKSKKNEFFTGMHSGASNLPELITPSHFINQEATFSDSLEQTQILETWPENIIVFRVYQTLMKSGNTSIYSLYLELSAKLKNLEFDLLRMVVSENPLFFIDSKSVSIVSSLDIGGNLLKLSTNIKQSTTARSGMYSLINKRQVVMKGNSVYILRIVAKLSTDNMESSLTFKFGSKECLKLKNESLLDLPNGCEALVDLRLRCTSFKEVKVDILRINIKDEQFITEEGKADSKYKNLMLNKVEVKAKKIMTVGTNLQNPRIQNTLGKEIDSDCKIHIFRAFIALKNDDITLNKLHTKVCKTPCKHTTEDLSVLVQKSSLFNIKSGNIIRVVSSLKIGGFLLDLACNTKKEACYDSENYSLINRNQVKIVKKSVYILQIGATLCCGKQKQIFFRFGTKGGLKLTVDVSKDLKLLNGQKALVDLRLCIQYKNIIASILAIYVNNETIFLGVGKKDSNYQNLLFNMTIKDEELMEKEQQVKSSSMENDEFDEHDEDDEIDIEDVCPVVSTASAPITTIQQEDELEDEVLDWILRYLAGRNQNKGTFLQEILSHLPKVLRNVYDLRKLKKLIDENSHIIELKNNGGFGLIPFKSKNIMKKKETNKKKNKDAEKIKNVIRAYLETKTGGVESMTYIVKYLRKRFPQEQILKENLQELILLYPAELRVVENTVSLVLSRDATEGGGRARPPPST